MFLVNQIPICLEEIVIGGVPCGFVVSMAGIKIMYTIQCRINSEESIGLNVGN